MTTYSVERNFMDNIYMTSMCVITPIIVTFATTLVTLLINAFTSICKFVKTKIVEFWYPQECMIFIEYTDDISQEKHKCLVNSILDYITTKSVYCTSMKCTITDGTNLKSTKDSILSRKHILLPNTPVSIENFKVWMTTTVIEKNTTYKLIISHPTSTEEIYNFMNKCLSTYVNSIYVEDTNQYYYELINANACVYTFNKFNISNNTTTFDSLFLPEKNKIIELLDKFTEGKLDKLALLLEGKPGVGKTSIIKAIAKKMKYSVISVKLSAVQSDNQFKKIFHTQLVPYGNVNTIGTNYDVVPLNKRIYILEDIDAEGSVVHKRMDPLLDAQCLSTKDDLINTLKEVTSQSALTLAGILNTLDGILELNTILIITTNHKEKLDEALIRPGRITMSLHLTKMTSEYAKQLIHNKFGSSIDIRDGIFTPAMLASYCQIATNIKELKDMVDKYIDKCTDVIE